MAKTRNKLSTKKKVRKTQSKQQKTSKKKKTNTKIKKYTKQIMKAGAKKTVLVLIHANWCGHCQRLMPDWNDMKKILIDNNNYLPEQIIEVESGEQDQKLNYINNNYITDNTKVMPEGYPTIGKIVNGHFDKYYGGRSLNELVQWAKPK